MKLRKHKIFIKKFYDYFKNIRAQKGLAALQNHTLENSTKHLLFLLNKLIMLYNQENFKQYSTSTISYKTISKCVYYLNILRPHKSLGQVGLASEAFKKVTELIQIMQMVLITSVLVLKIRRKLIKLRSIQKSIIN